MSATNNAAPESFNGFPADLFKFLEDLSANNNQKWFHKHYDHYQQLLVIPAKQFVAAIGDFVALLNPQFEIQPKFNKTLMRIARDARFAKGKPYRDYFLIGFHRWKWDSELFVYFDADGLEIGLFINNKKKHNEPSLSRYVTAKEMLLYEICDEYGIGKQYALSELGKGIDYLSKRFDVRKHKDYLRDIPLIIISKYYTKKSAVRMKEKIIGEAIKHFSTLYPLWILSESAHPEKDLRKHANNLGPVRAVS